MSPEMGFGVEQGQLKKARIHASDFFDDVGHSNTLTSNALSLKQATQLCPNAYASPPSSTATVWPNHSWTASDNKTSGTKQQLVQNAINEAIKVAERKTADYLQAKESAEGQLRAYKASKEALAMANQKLTVENHKLKEDFQKLEKHTKNCEKATGKAQKDVKHAKVYADHLIKSQKGKLISAEHRFADAARELKEWRDKYGWSVEKPAEEKAALHESLSEWQSKAEKAQNEIAGLKGGFQGQQSGIKVEKDQSDIEAEGKQSGIKAEENQSSTKVEENENIAAAEAKAAKYKAERDLLHRMLQEEMAGKTKLAESLMLDKAKLAESLEGLDTDEGQS